MNQEELLDIGVKKRNGEISESWSDLAKGHFVSGDAFRKWVKRRQHHSIEPNDMIETKYKESIEIHTDGSQSSNRLLRMSNEDTKDADYLLRAHGYASNKWEITSAKSNIWNAYSDKSGIMQLYSSKISVKPKQDGIDWDKLIKVIQNTPPVIVEYGYVPINGDYLNVPLFDMHFGINNYEHYKPTQAKVISILSKGHKEALFIIGSDLFHHNDHRNRTASGREIEHADMSKAWEEAAKFYEPLLHEAIRTCRKVTGIFTKGNHSESLEWAFAKYLGARFPQITFDTRFRERKVHMLGNVFVGSTHGDKGKKRLGELFSTEFPIQWSQAKTREVYTGHEHHETVEDKGGLVFRQLSTRNKVDQYHDDYGYTASHKRFQVFEYSEDELEHIYFV